MKVDYWDYFLLSNPAMGALAFVAAAVGFLVLLAAHNNYTETLRKLGDLGAYRDELRKRWPGEQWE